MNMKGIIAKRGLHLGLSGSKDEHTRFFPGSRNAVGFGGSLWNIGFSIMIPLPDLSVPEDVREDIKYFDFQGSLYARHWLLDGIYQRYQGFKVAPASGLFSPAAGDTIFVPDLKVRYVHVGATRVFNGNRLVLSAPFNQLNRQLKSAASFLLSGGLSFFNIHDKQAIVPQAHSRTIDLKEIRTRSMEVQPGAAGTYVFRNNWYLHGIGLAGMSLQHQYLEREKAQRKWSVEPALDARLAFGFDNGQYFAGFWGVSRYMQIRTAPEIRLVNASYNFRFFAGLRFVEPSFLRKHKPGILDKLSRR